MRSHLLQLPDLGCAASLQLVCLCCQSFQLPLQLLSLCCSRLQHSSESAFDAASTPSAQLQDRKALRALSWSPQVSSRLDTRWPAAHGHGFSQCMAQASGRPADTRRLCLSLKLGPLKFYSP